MKKAKDKRPFIVAVMLVPIVLQRPSFRVSIYMTVLLIIMFLVIDYRKLVRFVNTVIRDHGKLVQGIRANDHNTGSQCLPISFL
jgi:hypothetical protein